MISSAASSGGGAEDGKLDVSSVLKTSRSPDFLPFIEDRSPDDRDGVGRGSVVTGHLSVELADSSVE